MNDERLVAERREKWTGPPTSWRATPESLLQRSMRSIGSKVSALVSGTVPSVSAVRTVHLDPSIAINSEAYASLEQAVQATGARIIEKHSNAIQDILVVDAPVDAIASISDVAGVQSVAPRGKARPASVQAKSRGGDSLVFTGSDACTSNEAARGATKLDTLPFEVKSVLNDGTGTLVVVWDFAPDLDVTQWGDELVKRPGGKAVQYNLTSASPRGWHGSSVMSVCCGESAGPAKGASLAMVALGDTVSSDLTVINNLLDKWKGPAVVNMSFTVQYPVANDTDRTAIRSELNRFDTFVRAMKAKNPRLVFVVAAGNEARDVCDVADVPGDNGTREIQWPQQRFGATTSPYVFVGATITGSNSGTVTQSLANYSNYGRCVSALAPGGWTCAYRALLASDREAPFQVTQGTSFAAPATSGLLALVLAARPGSSGEDAANALLAGSRTVSGVPNGTSNALVSLPMDAVPPPGETTTAPPAEILPDPSVLAPEQTLPPPAPRPLSSELPSFVPWITAAVVVVLFAMAAFSGKIVFLIATVVAAVVFAVIIVAIYRLTASSVDPPSSSLPPLVVGMPRPAE